MNHLIHRLSIDFTSSFDKAFDELATCIDTMLTFFNGLQGIFLKYMAAIPASNDRVEIVFYTMIVLLLTTILFSAYPSTHLLL